MEMEKLTSAAAAAVGRKSDSLEKKKAGGSKEMRGAMQVGGALYPAPAKDPHVPSPHLLQLPGYSFYDVIQACHRVLRGQVETPTVTHPCYGPQHPTRDWLAGNSRSSSKRSILINPLPQ